MMVNATASLYAALRALIPGIPGNATRIVLTLGVDLAPTVECTFHPEPAEIDVTNLASSARAFALIPNPPITRSFLISEA